MGGRANEANDSCSEPTRGGRVPTVSAGLAWSFPGLIGTTRGAPSPFAEPLAAIA